MSAQNGTTLEGMIGGLPGVRQFGLNTNQPVDFSGAPSVALPGGTTIAGASNITSTSATALTVAASGTNYGLQVDESTASAVTGIKIKSAAAGAGVALSAISSQSNEQLTIDSKGSSNIALNANGGTGNIYLGQNLLVHSASANALSVGPNDSTNPVFSVDASTASQAAGLKLTGAATGGTIALQAIDSGSNTNIILDGKGSGTIGINTASTTSGLVTIGNSNSGGGVQVNGSVANSSFGATALSTSRTGSNPIFNVDNSTSSAVAGINIKGAATGGTVAITTTDSGSATNLTIASKGTGTITFNPAITATAGGASNDGIMFGSLGVGLFTGTGSPSFSAMNGSIYVDSAATSTTTRIYVNKSGAGTAGTTWTNLTTAA